MMHGKEEVRENLEAGMESQLDAEAGNSSVSWQK